MIAVSGSWLVGLGACLAGLGSFLTGWAALRAASQSKGEKKDEDVKQTSSVNGR